MNTHSFHIPVLGIGFSADTPVKVAKFGINSVMSIVDDMLLEKLRKVYCGKYKMPYDEITNKVKDFRAKRITSYLNVVNSIAEEKFEELKNASIEKSHEVKEYFSMLPDSSTIKQEFENLTSKYFNIDEIRSWLKENLSMGSIDVNIMTKIDKDNYVNGEKLPIEFNDAHAALRGYASSNLKSSIILSAGMSPRLYGYMEQFNDFFPNESGEIKKKIVLKVSDYRSALIQGKFFAKKGLWVSEYRIESGLNCGGHAFATEGFLLGPILSEFKKHRDELHNSLNKLIKDSLASKGKAVPHNDLHLKITAQGGVGTAEEHQFLLDHYQVESVGWGTPFLLVPEASNVDNTTMEALIKAEEKDLYLSEISPLGVPFNSLRGNTKDIEKLALIEEGKPGSTCPSKYLTFNTDYTERAICTASRQFQRIKIKELKEKELSTTEYKTEFDKITNKSCICYGLSASAVIVNDVNRLSDGVSVCPGPNMAYFSKKMTLKEITDHIYGRKNVISRTDRPHMFIKELNIYIEYLKNRIEESNISMTKKQEKYLHSFTNNMNEGIDYYKGLFSDLKDKFTDKRDSILDELNISSKTLSQLFSEIKSTTTN